MTVISRCLKRTWLTSAAIGAVIALVFPGMAFSQTDRVGDLMSKAEKASRAGDAARGIRLLEPQVDHPRLGYLVAYDLGVLYEQNGEPDSARRMYRRSLESRPEFTPALFNLVMMHIREDRIDSAENVIQKVAKKAKKDLGHKAIELRIDLARQQYRDVIRRAKQLLREDEKNPWVMVAMAEANLHLDRFELTLAVLDRAKKITDKREANGLAGQVYYLYGLVHMRQNNQKEAIQAFKKAIEANPALPEAHNNLGLLYYEATNYEKALQSFESALNMAPNYKKAHLNVGNVYREMQKPQKAKESFEKAKQIDPDSTDAYFNLGTLYLDSDFSDLDKLKRLREAIEYFNQFKTKARGRDKDGIEQADKYIDEANKAIELEKKRRKMMRKQQKTSGSGN